MNSLFEDLKQGLEEAIEYEKDQGKGNVKSYLVKTEKEYSSEEYTREKNESRNDQG